MSAAKLVAVDIGNSYAKLGLFAPDAIAQQSAGELPSPAKTTDFPTAQGPSAQVLNWLPNHPLIWRATSVNRAGSDRLTAWLQQHRPDDDLQFLTRDSFSIAVKVDEPDKVGLDRLAAAVAANVLRPENTPAIVVGAGTAITVNLISEQGAFLGGAILPGFRLSAEALYGGADFLPLALLEPNAEPPSPVGRNTEHAIRSGLFWGAVGAVRELITRMKLELATQPALFITGGDLRRLSLVLDEQAHYLPHLTLSGIAIGRL
jgi:type III pantothenate kinase